ncbi:unnamed protein product [Porites evermanni]|uniref:Uncharacterized protein n=1 Tax=Porites evermanni TaxID=104178 RepID=A0ABN8LR59_9CNID|nr:unnamed protein product [Porites evermanni]
MKDKGAQSSSSSPNRQKKDTGASRALKCMIPTPKARTKYHINNMVFQAIMVDEGSYASVQQHPPFMPHFSGGYLIGPEVDKIFDTLPNTGDDSDYATAVKKLNEYFSPQTNIAYEVYNFHQTKQTDGESLDGYHT